MVFQLRRKIRKGICELPKRLRPDVDSGEKQLIQRTFDIGIMLEIYVLIFWNFRDVIQQTLLAFVFFLFSENLRNLAPEAAFDEIDYT